MSNDKIKELAKVKKKISNPTDFINLITPDTTEREIMVHHRQVAALLNEVGPTQRFNILSNFIPSLLVMSLNYDSGIQFIEFLQESYPQFYNDTMELLNEFKKLDRKN